ncbi:DNA-binding transcriptional ArsR family regulator [Pseudomonas sp. ADAK2 TE3594]|jgi:DNA-binding transcriptional ArsR family regulator|nr:putative transcriptional regulator [Pseudomonas sp. GM50]EJN23762.1 putative transcriptional regulator [Pseudomonas sp. GM79]SDT47045.1 DNA-binding transcriptional regulator, ArsR family [Pseudomonas lini]
MFKHNVRSLSDVEGILQMQSSLTECEVAQLRASASKACALLKALANEDRLLILCQLTQGERNVGELEKMTGVRQPTLSQQLGILRDEGLVVTRREGKYIFYGLASHEVIQVMKTLSGLYCGAVLKSWG